MNFKDLIINFCDDSDGKYEVYQNYSGRFMYGRRCIGIIVNRDYSYMEMIVHLTRFLEEHDFDDYDLIDGVAIDSLGLDTIVYFPASGECHVD
jgi:hypothetical protein